MDTREQLSLRVQVAKLGEAEPATARLRSGRAGGAQVRILFVCATGGSGRQQLGGAERFLIEMLPEFSRRAEVAAVIPNGAVSVALSGAGVHVYEAGPGRKIDLAYRAAIRDAIRDFHPDVVSAHLLSSAMHTRSLRGRDFPASRLVVTLHNSLKQYVEASTGRHRLRMRSNLLLDRLQRVTRRHTSIAVSRYEADELSNIRFGGPVRCIPNPLPRDFGADGQQRDMTAARAALGLPASGRLFAYVGRMEIEKGADLLDSIAECLEPDDLLVAFGDGLVRPASPRVMYMGRTSKPELVWPSVDAVVMPSRVEAFGRVALEAVASGTPVVHTGVGGLQELLAPAEGVLAYTTSLDPVQLARKLTTSGLRNHAQESARNALAKRYAERYGFSKKVDEWYEVFASLVGQ
ncbi:glycosyltransferase family 4 protein [Mycobacterium sp. WMMD1722]|uniref:glycosyltransferase family 4 protein n=1 Tax=Mycobacterium sp. WMMD1722 TaxID=3404117 RepID=UPI003BF4F9C7